MAKVLVASVIMSEDGKFCSHHGVDWAELNQVIQEADARPRGASTLAMQTARNLFLWQGRSYLRKALEIPIALYGDLVWGKRREMDCCLSTLPNGGPRIFGIEAAARHYFSVPAKSLNARAIRAVGGDAAQSGRPRSGPSLGADERARGHGRGARPRLRRLYRLPLRVRAAIRRPRFIPKEFTSWPSPSERPRA